MMEKLPLHVVNKCFEAAGFDTLEMIAERKLAMNLVIQLNKLNSS